LNLIECWFMLLGFPLDFWATKHIQSAVTTFGRVLHWEDDHSNLTQILVKARVSDLEAVPRFIVLSEVECFLGQSWTIQCEIIHQNLLGAQPSDEDLAPLDDPLANDPPFDFFGLGQPMNQNRPDLVMGDNVVNERPDNIGWGQWLAGVANVAPAANAILALEANANPQMHGLIVLVDEAAPQPMELDLNVAPEVELEHLDFPTEEEEVMSVENIVIALTGTPNYDQSSENSVQGNPQRWF
jgi:hypothetical protein